MLFRSLIEATLSQLAVKQRSITRRFPDFFSNPEKVPGIIAKGGLRMTDTGKDQWDFKVHSGSEEGKWYEVNLKWKNVVPELQRAIANRRNWNRAKTKIDLKKVAAVLFKKLDVELLCDCPADLYYGGHYIRSKDKYRAKYGEPENRPPEIRNPKEYGAFCKHIQALFKALPWYKSTMANWLKTNYGDVIKKAEDKAAKTAAKYAARGKALGKRKAKESINELIENWDGSFEFAGNPPYGSGMLIYKAINEDGEEVGRYVISREHRKREIHIYEAEVEPEARGQDITKKFLHHLGGKYKNMDVFVVHIIPSAAGFWSKLGFEEFGTEGLMKRKI